MKLKPKRKATADNVRRVALAALVSALDDGKQEAKQKPGLTGVRAVATGAVVYTAGRAAFKGQRFVRERLVNRAEEEDVDEDEERDEPEAEEEDVDEDEEREEPEAEEDDVDGDDDGRGEDDEPESDDRPGGSEEEEPVGEEDSDESEAEGQDADDERPPTPDLQPARPAARKKGKQTLSLPERPSRSRSPLSRA